MVYFPYGCLEPLAAGVVNREVRERVFVAPWNERVGHHGPVRVVWSCAEDIVAESALSAIGDPGWVVEEGFKVAGAAIVQVDVDSAKMEEEKVLESVDSLHRVPVTFVGGQKPLVIRGNELKRQGLGP